METSREPAKKAYALVGASAAIAAAVGPLLGGFITTYMSWRVGFLLEAVIIAVVLSGIGLVRDAPYTGPRSVDLVGAILSVLGMARRRSGHPGVAGRRSTRRPADRGAGCRAGSAGLLAGAARAGQPTLIDPDLFKIKTFRFGISDQMLQQIALGGAMIALPIYLQMVLEYNAMQAGLSLAPLSLSMFAVALLAGKKSGDRRPSSIILAGRAARRRTAVLLLLVPRADSAGTSSPC